MCLESEILVQTHIAARLPPLFPMIRYGNNAYECGNQGSLNKKRPVKSCAGRKGGN